MSWASRDLRMRAERTRRRSNSKARGQSAAAWFGAQSFHTFLTAPSTGPVLDAMLADNAAADALIARKTDTAPTRVTCAWCPDFDGRQSSHRGASHGMCASCAALFDAAIDADRANGDDQDDSDRDGEACTAACGHCGRCS